MNKIYLIIIGLIIIGAVFITSKPMQEIFKVYLVNPPDTTIINHVYTLNDSNLSHNNLNGLQGGVANEYYHLNESEYRSYNPSSWNSHVSSTSNPHSVTKAQIGLSNVENQALSIWSGSSNLVTLGTLPKLSINQTSTTGSAITVSRNLSAASTDSPLVYFYNENSGDDQNVLKIINDGTGNGIFIDQNGDGISLNIDSESASHNAITVAAKYGLQITQDISGGRGIYLYRNLNEGGNNPLLDLKDDHTAVTQPSARIVYDGDAGASSGALQITTTNSNNDNAIYHSSGAKLTQAGVWTNAPSYSWMKQTKITDKEIDILDKFRSLPIQQWQWKDETVCRGTYTTSDNSTNKITTPLCINNYQADDKVHWGAYLDDMAAVFGVDNTGVNTQDWVGINQMAIKQLIEKMDKIEAKLTAICKDHPYIEECR